jgi:site-specific DNA-methyltransferase (adenine-specific)
LKIRLLGVKEKPETRNEAIQFLQDKLSSQKVFMKFDTIKHDEQNNLFCYLYLQNKTFLNAHLIKESLVSVDTDTNFKYRERFEVLAKEKVFQG